LNFEKRKNKYNNFFKWVDQSVPAFIFKNHTKKGALKEKLLLNAKIK